MEWKIDIDVCADGLCEKDFYCMLCDEQIDNPLCPNCIANGFKQWIQKLPRGIGKRLRGKVDFFLKKYGTLDEKFIDCVSCNHPGISVCPDCFVDFLYQICLEEKVSVSFLREFLLIFGFNFHRKETVPSVAETP